VEGPGHVPMDQIEFQRSKADGGAAKLPSMCWVRWSRHRPGYTHTSAIGRGRLGGLGTARPMLCLRDPKEHLAAPNAKTCARGLIAYKIATPTPPTSAATGRAPATATTNQPRPLRFRLEQASSISSLDPERAREYHDETAAADIYKSRITAQCAAPSTARLPGPRHR